MTPEQAIDLTTLIWGVAAVAALVIAVPQSALLARTTPPSRRDRNWWFRLMSTLLFGALGIAMLRNVVVWADLAYFDQRVLGPIARRWPLDLGLAVAICVACVLAAWLYVKTQREGSES